jgi:hypothetical protein
VQKRRNNVNPLAATDRYGIPFARLIWRF